MPELNLGFVHEYVPSTSGSPYTLLVLHGTGGDEHDLLPLGAQLGGGAAMLSPRGKSLENGMNRFFRRSAMGVFDLEDLKARTHELAGFVSSAAERYGFDPKKVIALGYSNGANIAASLLLLRPGVLAGAVLLRPMTPLIPEPLPSLDGVPVWLGGGRKDTMIPPAKTQELAELLALAGANVQTHWSQLGHELGQAELREAHCWLGNLLA